MNAGTGGTVYFLGAGASKAICPRLPLARELTLRDLADPQNYSNDIPPESECRAVREFLDALPEGTRVGSQPIEEALETLQYRAVEQYDLVLYCLLMRLSVYYYLGHESHVLKNFLRFVRENRHTIITPNYDTLIEVTLASMGTGEYQPGDVISRDALHWIDFGISAAKVHRYEYRDPWPTPPEQSLLLLKLHGSISWLLCRECGFYSLDPIWQNAADALARPEAYAPCPKCHSTAHRRQLVIVPPRLKKEYEDSVILEIWDRAEEVLSRSEEIIFVGFSLNETDRGIHDLLRRAYSMGSTKRLVLVDPAWRNLEPSYRSIYGENLQLSSERDWNTYLEKFFSAPRGHSERLSSVVAQ